MGVKGAQGPTASGHSWRFPGQVKNATLGRSKGTRRQARSPSSGGQPTPSQMLLDQGCYARSGGLRGRPWHSPATQWHVCGARPPTWPGKQTVGYTCDLGRAFTGYKCQSKNSKMTQPGTGRNRVTRLPFLSSLSTEHPAACAPASVPGGATFAADAEQSGWLVSHRTRYCSVGRNSWID